MTEMKSQNYHLQPLKGSVIVVANQVIRVQNAGKDCEGAVSSATAVRVREDKNSTQQPTCDSRGTYSTLNKAHPYKCLEIKIVS